MNIKIIIVVLAFIGLIMAAIGIDFYNKCKKDKKLSAASRNFLILLLVVFILLIVGTVIWWQAPVLSYALAHRADKLATQIWKV